MHRIHRFILAAAFVAGMTRAAAQTPLTFTFTPAFVSQYMFRGVRIDGPCFQPAIEADAGNFALGVWASTPLWSKVPGNSDPEIDPYGSYTLKLTDAVSVQPGFTLYTYPRAPLDQGYYHSTFEPYLAAILTLGPLQLTPKLYYDVVLKGATYELTAATALPLPSLGTELDFTAVAGTFKLTDVANHASPAVKNWGNYWSIGVSAPVVLSRHSKVMLGFAYVKGSDNYFKQGSAPRELNTAAGGRGVFTLSYSVTF